MKIILMVKSGMVGIVDCPENVEILLRDYDITGYANDSRDIHTDDLGDEYIECCLN